MDEENKPNRLRNTSLFLIGLGLTGIVLGSCGSLISPNNINMSSICLPSLVPILIGGTGLIASINPYFNSRDLRKQIPPDQTPPGYE